MGWFDTIEFFLLRAINENTFFLLPTKVKTKNLESPMRISQLISKSKFIILLKESLKYCYLDNFK